MLQIKTGQQTERGKQYTHTEREREGEGERERETAVGRCRVLHF